MSERDPTRFGKYLLLERIGVGGMAEVFKAKIFGAEGFERLVAIKRILPHLTEDDDFVKMFVDEAKIAVRINHPNIVAIHDLGKAEGTLYIAMELVPGKDLRAIYDVEKEREGKTPIGIACHIVMKMCEALHHAHFATGPRGEPLQVIHRDVSPQNVLISLDGEVKVADFGLAKARGRMVQTQAGVVKGKLAYMSPEQLRGEDIDHRVDVFGLGIVLYELLTGERLFLGPSDMDTLRRVYEARVPPMQPLNPEVHPDLEAIVRKALAKERDERYGTALELHDDLQTFVYSHGCYCGASSLRSYLREAFPDFGPVEDEGLPPFASAPPRAQPPPPPPRPPELAPRPTHRPPALSRREEIPPPASIAPEEIDLEVDVQMETSMLVDAARDMEEILAPPPMPDIAPAGDYASGPYSPAPNPAGPHASAPADPSPPVDYPADYQTGESDFREPPMFEDSTAHEDIYDAENEIAQEDDVDDLPTDRPPPLDALPPEVVVPPQAVVARRVIETGRPPPPESSGTVPTSADHGFPSIPAGIYEDEFPTEQIPGSTLRVEPGPDTNRAPAMPAPAMGNLAEFVSDDWPGEDDEPTMFESGPIIPPGAPPSKGTTPRPEEVPDEEEQWGGDATVVVDPRSSGGRGG